MANPAKFISLRTKTILLLVGVFLFMLVGTVGILNTVMLNRFETIEKKILSDHLTRTENTLNEKVNSLSKIAFDWAVWDDTYTFIEDHNIQYRDANLVEEVYANLDVNAMVFIDKAGQFVYAQAKNPEVGDLGPISQSLQDYLIGSAIYENNDPNYRLSGIIKLPEGLMMIASCPILKSDGTGSVRGNLIIAYLIDNSYVTELKDQLKLDLTLETVTDPLLGSTNLDTSSNTYKVLSANLIKASTFIKDVEGTIVLKLSIITDRATYNAGKEGVFFVGGFITLLSFLCIIVLSFFMNSHFLTKLRYISSTVDRIGRDKDFNSRLKSMTSVDEFTIVVNEVNGMLDDLESVHKENEFKANHDVLTGLPNRRLLSELMAHAIEQTERSGKMLAVMFLDLDDFKIINDTKGHDYGDEILKYVADHLAKNLRKSDVLVRIGGDEFIIMLENVDNIHHVRKTADKILKTFKEVENINGMDFFLSTSIGIA